MAHRLYDMFMFETSQETWEATLALLHPSPGQKLLDGGTGTGRLAIAIADQVGDEGKVYGVDVSPAMLRQARRQITRTPIADRIELRLGDVRSLPFANGSLDGAAVSLVLELLSPEGTSAALSELRRVVRPGGRIVLAALAEELPYGRTLSFYLVLRGIFRLAALGRPLALRKLATQAGLLARISMRRDLLRLPIDILLCEVPKTAD
jgi:demethylmenaquinone methyltransferase/2-methoxy-6-polyprenyl-1,4-benzoquinol methylase